MKSTEQNIIENHFGVEVEKVISENEFKIAGSIYQVQPVDYIDNDEEFAHLAEESIEVEGYYLIKQ